MFEGGYSQWGCGTASSVAATVLESATGISSEVHLTSVSVSFTFTQSPSSLETPTQSGSGTLSSDSTTSSSSSSSRSTLASDTLTTISIPSPTETASPTLTSNSSSPTSTPTSASAPDTTAGGGGTSKRTGAIVGGTIGAVAALAGIAAVAIYLWRRRAAQNTREGPGPRPGDTHYTSPMSGGGGGGFLPLPGGRNGGGGGKQAASVRGKKITHITGGPDTRNTVWQDGGIGDQPYTRQQPTTAWRAGAGAGAGAGAYGGAYASPHDSSGEDEIPLRQTSPEMEDFSRGFHDALSRIGEEDESELDEVHGNGTMRGTNGGGNGDIGESRPLWLQSRRQSRNLMWT